MLGLVLIYANHGINEYLEKLGYPQYYHFSVLDGLVREFLLGLVNFVAISFFVDQVIQKKTVMKNVKKIFARSFFSEDRPNEWEVYAHFTASINAIFYFLTCMIALFPTPGTMNPNFIILTFGLGSVMSLFTWVYIFFHHYPLDKCHSIDRLKMDHSVPLELTLQFIFVGSATATGLIVYGVVNWLIATPLATSSTQYFQFTLFSLAATCIYIYASFFLGVISPLLVFLGKISERIEQIDELGTKNQMAKK
jgi:hypothetical protein